MDSKKRGTNSTISLCRGVFLPVHRPNTKTPDPSKKELVKIENRYGICAIFDEYLTQTHQNIIDAILYCAEYARTTPEGRYVVLYQQSEVLKIMGHRRGTNQLWLKEKIRELSKVIMQYNSSWGNRTIKIEGHIVDSHNESKVQNDKTGKVYYGIVFSEHFRKFWQLDTGVDYFRLIPDILRLESAQAQALARYCLSQDTVNTALDAILSELHPNWKDMTLQNRNKIKAGVLAEREAMEKSFGICLREIKSGENAGKMGVFYTKHRAVYFQKPVPAVTATQNVKKVQTAQG